MTIENMSFIKACYMTFFLEKLMPQRMKYVNTSLGTSVTN